MKKYFGTILMIALGVGLVSCVDDDDNDGGAPAGNNTPAFDSRLRIDRGGQTTTYTAYTTFTEEYVESFELNVFSIDMIQNLNLPESIFLVGMSIYSSDPVFETLTEDTNYPFTDSWVAGGPEDSLGLGVTWRDEEGNATLYSEVIEGNMFVTDVRNTLVRGTFSFTIVSPQTGDTLKATSSLVMARPQ